MSDLDGAVRILLLYELVYTMIWNMSVADERWHQREFRRNKMCIKKQYCATQSTRTRVQPAAMGSQEFYLYYIYQTQQTQPSWDMDCSKTLEQQLNLNPLLNRVRGQAPIIWTPQVHYDLLFLTERQGSRN